MPSDKKSSPSTGPERSLSEFVLLYDKMKPQEAKAGECFFPLFGEFLIEFNKFEIELRWALTLLSLAEPTEAGHRPIAFVKSVHERLKLLEQLAALRFPKSEIYSEALKIKKIMRRINSFRNTLVHGEWRSMGPGGAGWVNEHGKMEVEIQYRAFILYFDSTDGVYHHLNISPDDIRPFIRDLEKTTKDIREINHLVRVQNRQEFIAKQP